MAGNRFIDLFAGCGGLSLGLFQAGWQGVFAIEKSPDAFATLKRNLCSDEKDFQFDWPTWLACGAQTTDKLLRRHKDDLLNLRGKVDLIAGGPPCQGFSTAGLRNPDDPRNRLTSEYIRIVDIVQPKFLLLENVRGFQAPFEGAPQPYSARVVKRLGKLAQPYDVFTGMLRAVDFGVPQPRARFILVGIRRDLKLAQVNVLEKVLGSLVSFRKKKGLSHLRPVTSRQAISDLEVGRYEVVPSRDTDGFSEIQYKCSGKLSNYQKLLREGLETDFVPNSLRLPNHAEKTRARFRHILKHCSAGKTVPKKYRDKHGMKKQCIAPMHPNRPARTITTLPDDMVHYSEPRVLTVRENARLQSFPDWFEFCGKYTTGGKVRRTQCPRYTQVGNAVPPLMAEAIGITLLKLKGGR